MKIGCKCGAVIYDQTDFLSYKAHFVADQDWFDFAESTEKNGRVDASLVRQCYQCRACGRLYIDDFNRELRSFVPEEQSNDVLRSCKGDAWPAPLIAHWIDKPSPIQARGTFWCESAKLVKKDYATWEEFEQDYYALFNNLKALGLLRSAYLTKNQNAVHSWSPDAEASNQ
jgi:hypothetical protein